MSNSKNITLENLTRYDTNIKEYIANQGGATWDTTTGKPFETLDPSTFSVSSDGVLKATSSEITIDSELSDSSENPVQNKVVTSALQDKVDNTQIVTSTSNGLMTSTDKAKLDGIDEGANKYTLPTASSSTLGGVKTTSSVSDSSGYTACPIISGVPYYKDTNTDTHYTTGLKVGASNTATANAAASNGNVYLNVLDNSTVRDSHKIVGSGATTVSSDDNGVITIKSTDTNTDTKCTAVGNHYTPSGGTTTSASGGTLTDITNSSRGVQVVTGVVKDAAGHVTGVTSVALKSVNTDTTYSNFVKSGSGAKSGLVPAPSTTAGTTKYLCEDGTWKVPTIPVLTADPKNPADGQIWIKST